MRALMNSGESASWAGCTRTPTGTRTADGEANAARACANACSRARRFWACCVAELATDCSEVCMWGATAGGGGGGVQAKAGGGKGSITGSMYGSGSGAGLTSSTSDSNADCHIAPPPMAHGAYMPAGGASCRGSRDGSTFGAADGAAAARAARARERACAGGAYASRWADALMTASHCPGARTNPMACRLVRLSRCLCSSVVREPWCARAAVCVLLSEPAHGKPRNRPNRGKKRENTVSACSNGAAIANRHSTEPVCGCAPAPLMWLNQYVAVCRKNPGPLCERATSSKPGRCFTHTD